MIPPRPSRGLNSWGARAVQRRMPDTLSVKRGASTSRDPVVAAEELHAAIFDPSAALTLFFCSPDYDLDALGAELVRRFGDAPLVGCTTAGEIGPFGYREGSISGVSIGGPGFQVATVRVDELRHFELARGDAAARAAIAKLGWSDGMIRSDDAFGFLLVDGLSTQEEALVSALYRTLGSIQLFGGSAGDGAKFEQTFVFHEGRFRADCAVFTLVECRHPFVVFKTEHFVASSDKMVVTKADHARRIVNEINGAPAAREYARVVGLPTDALTPMVFADHPVVVRVGGSVYVRSIQKVNEDDSLTFFCAIDEGIVLTVAKGVDMVENLEEAFASVERAIGPPDLVIGCDCVLRSLEAGERRIRDRIGSVMAKNNVVGFATYGEQFNAMHVNQTFTGVAIAGGVGDGG